MQIHAAFPQIPQISLLDASTLVRETRNFFTSKCFFNPNRNESPREDRWHGLFCCFSLLAQIGFISE